MSNVNRTFGTTVPAYFLGRPRSVYEVRYRPTPRPATVAALAAVRPLATAA